MSRSKGGFRIGDYFLGRRSNSSVYCACWFDKRSRQTRRTSLGARDLREAEIALARFVTQHGAIRNADPKVITFAQILERYWHQHGQRLRAAADARRHMALLIEHFQDAAV